MPTFREFLKVAQLTVKDKTSGKRMKEIRKILRKHKILRGLTPEKATAILEDLGPTYVKIGQMMSNRSDFLPQEYCDAFASLRANVPPLPFETVIERIEAAYGHPWQETFSHIDEQPLGSASIAQVHKGILHDGSVVAIKVQRPGIAKQMADDIMLMHHGLALADFSVSNEDMVITFEDLVNELEKTTAEELDFEVELDNLIRFHHDIESQAGVTSPLPYEKYSTPEVLVMEFVVGTLIGEKKALVKQGVDLSKIGERIAQSYVTQVVDNGFFHADPHPGNIVIRMREIVWIDLGMTGSLTSGERSTVGKIFNAIASNNPYALKEALLSLTRSKGSTDHGLLLDQMDSMLSSYRSVDLADLNIGRAFMDIIEILRSQNLSLPTSFTMLARGFLTLEGVVREISPTISIVTIISEHVKRQMYDWDTFEEKVKSIVASTLASSEAMTHIPTQVSNTLDMLDRGQLKVNADMKISDNAISSIYSVSGNLALAFISAGLFIGSSIMCTTDMTPQIFGVPLLGFLGFLGAFFLGVYVIFRAFSTRHKQRNNIKFN